ncbi:MAG: class II fumarate hydratase [Proteobacteria bacterium]|nr:class II fumarate hydratase [Pseudomonadota bacterium]
MYYGASTQRAVDNFVISGTVLPPVFHFSLALLKRCAAIVNMELDLLDLDMAQAIAQAAQEVMEESFDEHLVVDVFQTGSGTSTNMNMNEVIATRANDILDGEPRTKGRVHPNDHVNKCQSSNDVIPTCIHVASMLLLRFKLRPVLEELRDALTTKAEAWQEIRKIGRTHLQDAVEMTLGQEVSGFARQIELALNRLEAVEPRLTPLALGGTAVGTGLGAHPEFAARTIAAMAEYLELPFTETENHFEAQASIDSVVELSGALRTLAISLTKIANDIRWLGSGPRLGLGEIRLPALQPGSSIMPGKVNPVIPEVVVQVAAQVVGNDAAIAWGGAGGYFQLNTMLPLVAQNVLESMELLANAAQALTEKCVQGLIANEERCQSNIARSLAIVTNLVPHIGYDRAAEIANRAYESGQTIEEVALAEGIMDAAELHSVLFGEDR